MSRTYASVNEAWRELRNRASSDKRESSADAGRRHGYDPNQPRVPKGHPDGGQWTDQGESENDPRILSDVESNNDWASSARYASRRRRSGSVIINGQVVPVEPGQAARLAVAEARAHDALSRVRELDASWRPKPSAYATVEGLIRAYEADTQAAEARIAALTSAGIGPGPQATMAYRAGRLLKENDTVAVTTLDGEEVFGSNSTARGYSKTRDGYPARRMRDVLIRKYPGLMKQDNIGQKPNDALFHAETTVLLRAARQNGGTLEGRTLEVYVDREMCNSCELVLPKVGLELGNPTVTFVGPARQRLIMKDGKWLP